MRTVGAHQQRVAVRRGARDVERRERSVGARPVLDDDALLERDVSGWATMRVIVSVPLPGPNGTMKVIGLLG